VNHYQQGTQVERNQEFAFTRTELSFMLLPRNAYNSSLLLGHLKNAVSWSVEVK
jgi:hypothetical protein